MQAGLAASALSNWATSALEHPQVLFGREQLGMPVRCAETKFHVGTFATSPYQPGEM